MSVPEDRLRRIADAGMTEAPPVARVIVRGRQIRRRRRQVVGAGAVVAVLGAGLSVWPGVGPAQVIAGGSALTAVPDGQHCRIVGRHAGPKVADGLRLMPDASTVPADLRMNFASAAQGTGCPRPAGPLVLVGYGADGRTVERTFAVWGPGADDFSLGDATGRQSVRGRAADAYGASNGQPVSALAWTEKGERWLATGHGLAPGELNRMVDALRIDAGTGVVTLPASYLAGFERIPPVPAFAGVPWRPIWTVYYTLRGHHTGELWITVTPTPRPLDALLRPGWRIVTVRGHRAAARINPPSAPGQLTDLMWEERPGILVDVFASGFEGTWPDLTRIAESLHPVSATDPRVTR